MKVKTIQMISSGTKTADGDGVNMTRLIGTNELNHVDPFLLLDAFGSDEPNDYLGGFPSHPHRGFETVTYMLAGKMRHKDNAGNEGVIEPGGVQWMTAGKGIVHSEMPEQTEGLMAGFQLWVNLPASQKMVEPAYQEFAESEVPVEQWDNGTTIRVITGSTELGTKGPVNNSYVTPLYMDVSLKSGKAFEQAINAKDNTIVYVIEGEITIGDSAEVLLEKKIGILEQGERLTIESKSPESRFIVITAEPLNEPIARGGPFVMNTEEEIRQAFSDYRSGQF